MLISLGFVKTAESFDSLKDQVEAVERSSSGPALLGNLPCGNNRR
jgi:hypothetical protein